MKNLKYQITVVLLFLLQLAQAQPGFESDDVQDATSEPVPIDDYLFCAVGLSIIIGYQLIKKKRRTSAKS